MVRYELKKILGRPSGKIAVFLLIAITALSCWLAFTGVEWVNEQGETETGLSAVHCLREARNEWAGILDEELLQRALMENQRINATPEAQSKDYTQNDIAYGWKQGFRPILDLINHSYAEGFRSYSYYTADAISPNAMGNFYANRAKSLSQWLYDEHNGADDLYSEKEKQYLISQYEATPTPFRFDYMEGWLKLEECSTYIIMIGAVILGYLVAGIFSNEFKWKADAVFYSTVHGRRKATTAKIKAGLLLITILYWSCIGIFSIFTLVTLGADGATCPVQADFTGWKCIYNVNHIQKYLIIVLLGYLGNLFFGLLTMWVSAKTKSAVFAVTLPFILIFLPSILGNINSPFLQDILGILPDRLLQINQAMQYMEVYEILDIVTGALPILAIVYTILTVIMIPVTCLEFRTKQVG